MSGAADDAPTVGSLFAGIGLLDLAVHRVLGSCTVWQVEIDPYRRAVLARHYPDAQRFDDVRAVGARELARVDGVIGGFPCRGTSSAGHRNGLKHEQSGLWREYARILGELRPSWALIENPAGLEHRGLDTVLADLDALGMHTRRGRLAAADVGAPHRRERIWILAYTDADRLQGLGAPHDHDGHHALRDDDAGRAAGLDWPPGPDATAAAWHDWINRNPGREPAVCRGPARGPGSMDGRRRRQRLAALGDSVCLRQAEVALTRLLLSVSTP